MPEGAASPALLRILAGALLAAFLIENGTDLAVWVHCGWRDAVHAAACHTQTRLVDVRLTGLAVGGLLSVAATAAVAYRRPQAVARALALMLGVMAAALFKILDIGTGARMYPDLRDVDTALFIWAVVLAGLLLVAAAPEGVMPFRPFADLCVAGMVALGLVALVFLLPVEAGWAPPGWGHGGYLLAYAVAAAPAGWAALLCAAANGGPGRATRLALRVLLTAVLCFGYGALVGWDSDTGFARGAVQPRFTGGMGSLLLLGGGVALGVAMAVAVQRRGAVASVALAGVMVGAGGLAVAEGVLALSGPAFAPVAGGTQAMFRAETVVALGLGAVAVVATPRVVRAVAGD